MHTALEIETAARTFTARQSEALAALELPARIDGELFEGLLDHVCDTLDLSEAGWDLFASVARLDFFGIAAPREDRRRWEYLADEARRDLCAEQADDRAAQLADLRYDAARDAA